MRLAEGGAVDLRNLVGPDDHRSGAARLHLLSLGDGQSERRRARGFTVERGLVDLRRLDIESESQPLQQLAAVTRG